MFVTFEASPTYLLAFNLPNDPVEVAEPLIDDLEDRSNPLIKDPLIALASWAELDM